jgi:hypothetical protein
MTEPSDELDLDSMPFVCPGCYGLDGEHAGYCPDAAIERDREERRDLDHLYDEEEPDSAPWW